MFLSDFTIHVFVSIVLCSEELLVYEIQTVFHFGDFSHFLKNYIYLDTTKVNGGMTSPYAVQIYAKSVCHI